MSETVHNRRTQKTKKAIRNSLAELLTEKELRKITVQELVDKADVGRATFYKHYYDIYDLYSKIEEETMTEIAWLALNIGELPSEEFFKGLLDYISENRMIFKMIFSPNSTGQLRANLTQMIEGVFRQVESEKTGIKFDDRKLSLINGYRVQGCLSVIAGWVDNDYKDSQEDVFQTLLLLDNNTTKLLL